MSSSDLIKSGPGRHILGLRVDRLTREEKPKMGKGMGQSRYTLTIDGEDAGSAESIWVSSC